MSRRDLLLIGMVVAGVGIVGTRLFQGLSTPSSAETYLADRNDSSVSAIAGRVDEQFESHWQEAKLQHAPTAADLVVARRLSLGLTGTVPSLEDVRKLEKIPAQDRLSWWVEHLLHDRRTSDYLAERFARAFVGVEDGPLLFRRRRFVIWLSDQFSANRPYNELVRELITNTGLWTDVPSVNFFTVTFDNQQNKLDMTRLAGRVSRAFLGMRIDCLQCHNDQLGNVTLGTAAAPREGTQQDFHQLAAFFGQTEASFFGVRELIEEDRQYEYKYLDAEQETIIQPQVPYAPALLSSEGKRRERLANWMTHAENRPFARAVVNRMWAILFGRPLVTPIDDIPLFEDRANDRLFPTALELLSQDFVSHGYDLRRLVRVIAHSKVYRLASQAEFEVLPQHEQEWAVFPLTRLRPEQVAGSIIQSCSIQTIDAESNIVTLLARFFEQDDFIKRYGDMGQDEFEERGGTVTQRLLMMNGKLVKGRTNQNLVNNAATQINGVTDDDAKSVDAAYLCVLARHPSQREAERFQQRLSGLKGNRRVQALEDLFWALLNSTEFSWNH